MSSIGAVSETSSSTTELSKEKTSEWNGREVILNPHLRSIATYNLSLGLLGGGLLGFAAGRIGGLMALALGLVGWVFSRGQAK